MNPQNPAHILHLIESNDIRFKLSNTGLDHPIWTNGTKPELHMPDQLRYHKKLKRELPSSFIKRICGQNYEMDSSLFVQIIFCLITHPVVGKMELFNLKNINAREYFQAMVRSYNYRVFHYVMDGDNPIFVHSEYDIDCENYKGIWLLEISRGQFLSLHDKPRIESLDYWTTMIRSIQ